MANAIPNQITPNAVQPYMNQANFGQITGRVLGYNPNVGATTVQNLINNVVRRIYDRRMWSGLLTKGQIVSPGYYSLGNVTVTVGSPIVQGNNTNWTTALTGLQFRQSFTSPIYNILAVNPATQQITLELPWGNISYTSIGYFITQLYYSFPNVKYFYSVKNLQMMYRMITNIPQSLLENWDPARLQYLYPRVLASMPPDANGNAQYELWPAPNVQQAYPYLAYAQPPNLVNDADNFPPFIRTDIIELGAIAEVLLHRPRENVAYSEAMALQLSERFSKHFEMELLHAASADEAIFRQDIVTDAEKFPLCNIDMASGAYIGGGGFMAAMSPVGSDYDDGY